MKKNFIRILFVGIFAFSTLSFISCGNKASNNDKDDKDNVETEESKNYFSSKDGMFKANFPGQPTQESQMVQTDVGKIEMFTFTYERSATEVYMIAYSDYPSSSIDKQDEMELLKSAKDGALGGNIVESNKEMKVNGWPAIRSKAIDKQSNTYYIYEVILAKNRLYQVFMIRNGSYCSDESVKDFLDTFIITMKK